MDVTATNPNSSQSSFTTAPLNASHPSSSSSPPSTVASATFSIPTAPVSQSSTNSFNPASSSFPQSLSQDTAAATTTAGNAPTLVDSNAPELFKQNIQIAMEQVARINALARSASNGIQSAYQADINPAQTKADLATLDQALHALADLLRQSGVGAYPLPEAGSAENDASLSPPTEQQLIADMTRGVQQLYDEFKRMQESSAVVANLLAVQENLGRPKA